MDIRKRSGIIWILFLLLAIPAWPAVIKMKNGGSVTGAIVYQDAQVIRVKRGDAEAVITRDRVASIQSNVWDTQLSMAIIEAADKAKEQLAKGRKDRARRILDLQLMQIKLALKEIPTPPQELLQIKQDLEQIREQTLAKEPTGQRAEQMYQQALVEIDHVNYQQAYDLLYEAAKLAPRRPDVQLELARVAETHMSRLETAIQAYRTLLELDPETYYTDSADRLLRLAQQCGRKLLNERRADEAIPYFKDYLLLQNDGQGGVISLEQFLKRKKDQASQPEDDLLMRVYKYADDNELVDLAFAAARRASQLRPKDDQVRQLAQSAGLTIKYRSSIETGNVAEAARLKKEIQDAPFTSPEMNDRLKRISGKLADKVEATSVQAEAKALLENIQKSMNAYDYRAAVESAQHLISDYAGTGEAAKANELLHKATREVPIQEKLDEARKLLAKARSDQAESLLNDLLATQDIEKSLQIEKIKDLKKLTGRERQAEAQWTLARAELTRKENEAALTRMEALRKDYGDTKAGREAADWLRGHNLGMKEEIENSKRVDAGLFSDWLDPSLRQPKDQRAKGPNSGRPAPALTATLYDKAWQAFEGVMSYDLGAQADSRSRLMNLGLPLGTGILLLLILLLRYVPFGRLHLAEAEAPASPLSATLDKLNPAGAEAGKCRMCGMQVKLKDGVCPSCGASGSFSSVEVDRHEAVSREADFDPWQYRVNPEEANRFAQFFQKARTHVERNELAEAIQACREALREDPHNMEGYELLADLYERTGDRDKALICYREIFLLDPQNSRVRLKLQSLLPPLLTQPLNLRPVIITLSFALWFLIFWLLTGLQPDHWMWYSGLTGGLCLLTIILWLWLQSRHTEEISAPNREAVDLSPIPLPPGNLKWKEQSRQARLIAERLRDHTGMKMPVLGIWRPILALTLSIVLLAALVAVAWIQHLPYALLGWPAGTLLLVYLIEIHPRALAATAILRHAYMETQSTWVDPHRPFQPAKLKKAVKGEFLTGTPGEFPLAWALHPHPYGLARQGVLNSLQQALNRHWDFHRFYSHLHLSERFDTSMPLGFKPLLVTTYLILVAAIGVAGWLGAMEWNHGKSYEDSMKVGYQYLLDGDATRARECLELAVQLEPVRVAPRLYLAHALAGANNTKRAEAAFREAAAMSPTCVAVYNDFGNFLQRQGRIKEAIPIYNTALGNAPQNADVMNNMGAATYKMKDYARAKQYLEGAVRVAPTHERAWTTLGLVCEALGQTARARQAFEKAVRAAPNLPYTQVAKERLKTLPMDEPPAAPDKATAVKSVATGKPQPPLGAPAK